ncbi:MAG TPA: ATP-binding protein, partial [Candidatus Eisenbacteria bacterium]|nr:ATP-binding protein [Candidatus Eisenbacteria bacterium]
EPVPGGSPPAVPARPRRSCRPTDPALAALFLQPRDLGALERMLLAWAVHPSGAGFDRASWLAFSPSRELLAGRLWWGAESSAGEPGAALLHAQRLASDGPDPERTRELRALTVRPEHLAGVADLAWRGSTIAVGPQARAGEMRLGPAAVFGAVALHRGTKGMALLVGEWERNGDPAARELKLGQFRDLAITALDAHWTREDLRRRLRHGHALGEFARACVSSLNLAEILDLAGRLAVQATGARGGAVWLADGAEPELRSTHGPLGTRERLGRALAPLAQAAMERARPLVLDRVTDEPRLMPDVAAQIQSLAVVPLNAYGRAIGALAVYDRGVSHPSESEAFDRTDLEFLGTLADLAALGEDQSRRCDALRQAEHRHRELQREVSRGARLAALGEMAARVAHEVRNPLASIGAFARRVHKGLAPEDPGREYLEIVIREAERLERMVGEQLQYATLQRPRLKLESMNGVVQEALQGAGERMVRRRVRLLKKLSPDLPALLLDAERIRRVVGNILDNALESVAPGGRVRVESRRSGAYVVVDIANDGLRRPGDLMEQLFVPFALSRQGGPGVGLAVAQQILKQHGGELRVRSEGEWSTIFSFTLPIPDNQDRRHHGADRRHSRADRRERYPAG